MSVDRNARVDLEWQLTLAAKMDLEAATAMLDAYRDLVAHELAERQRAALAENPGILEGPLIDLIDPEATSGG